MVFGGGQHVKYDIKQERQCFIEIIQTQKRELKIRRAAEYF